MNERLRLPEIFKGNWDNLLIFTFGADLPFFENALLRSNFNCKNKIILGDGKKLLKACERYARDQKVRMLNQTYVADGVYVQNAAHAKIILLLNHDKGSLYVGSGNLGIQGYTSGGEMFTSYHYTDKEQGALAAFQSAWEFVEILLKRRVIGGAAEAYVRKIPEQTPWLMRNPVKKWQPIRHNLNSSFLYQLKIEVGDEKVQELWIMSPFFDEKAVALSSLIEEFTPGKVNLIIQPQYVSIDKTALEKVINKHKGKIVIHPFEAFSDDVASAYVHTKLYLIKTKTRAICLQGSPNCSKAALLLPSPLGNIEMANLLTGSRNAFDELLEHLSLLPPLTSARSLNLKYERPDKSNEINIEETWLLTGAHWRGERLYLYFHKDIPNLKGARLQIGRLDFALQIANADNGVVEIKLPADAKEILSTGLLPIVLKVGKKESPSIFPYNVEALARESHSIQHDIISRNFEDFDPFMAEFEDLLAELSNSFPIDRKSIWQLAGKSHPKINDDEDDKALQIKYADIDYDLLRKHPKIQQYIHRKGTIGEYQHTRLQEILSSITRHFQGLTNSSFGKTRLKSLPVNEESEDEITESRPSEENNDHDKKPVKRRRVQRILKGFIQRYLRGLKSRDFIDLVGVDVIVNNYIIFSHILWKLLQKDLLEVDFLVDAILRMWSFFWGNSKNEGYLSSCNEKDRGKALNLINEKKAHAMVLVSLFYSDHKSMIDRDVDLRLRLRDAWRYFLLKKPFDVTADTLLDAWIYLYQALPYFSLTPGYIALGLDALARLDTAEDFLIDLEHQLGVSRNTCMLVSQEIYRESIDKILPMECLEVNSDQAIKDLDSALLILFSWMRYGKREFYRISSPRFILVYDTDINKGEFINRATKEGELLGELHFPDSEKWQEGMKKIVYLAKKADATISIRRAEFSRKIASDV